MTADDTAIVISKAPESGAFSFDDGDDSGT